MKSMYWIGRLMSVALLIASFGMASAQVRADDDTAELGDSAAVNLFGDDPIQIKKPSERPSRSPSSSSKMTAKEMRQARAIYRSQQRMLRREHQLWWGVEPLRPQFNSIPTMSSRYGRPTIYVPVYIH